MTTIAVIGAGISGLSAAYYLSKATHLKVISASDFISKNSCTYVTRFDVLLMAASVDGDSLLRYVVTVVY